MIKKIILIGLFCIGLVSLTSSLTSHIEAYGEKEGGWTASEKRQIISLLETIANNTEE